MRLIDEGFAQCRPGRGWAMTTSVRWPSPRRVRGVVGQPAHHLAHSEHSGSVAADAVRADRELVVPHVQAVLVLEVAVGRVHADNASGANVQQQARNVDIRTSRARWATRVCWAAPVAGFLPPSESVSRHYGFVSTPRSRQRV